MDLPKSSLSDLEVYNPHMERLNGEYIGGRSSPSIQECENFKQFIRLLRELYQCFNQCGCIQQGLPGAGSLRSAIDSVKGQLKEVNVESILTQGQGQYESLYEV